MPDDQANITIKRGNSVTYINLRIPDVMVQSALMALGIKIIREVA
jgi:hypothetical protein